LGSAALVFLDLGYYVLGDGLIGRDLFLQRQIVEAKPGHFRLDQAFHHVDE
jgi:hypothetical protein